MKCNTDGSVAGADRIAGCGGVARDMFGQWIFGFCRNLGSSNVLWTELWAIHTMLHLAWERRVPKVVIESDSAVAVNLIIDGCPVLHPYDSLVLQIREWRQKNWEVIILHIYREANRVADCLANLAHSFLVGVHVLDVPPSSCRDLLFADCTGVSFPRSALV